MPEPLSIILGAALLLAAGAAAWLLAGRARAMERLAGAEAERDRLRAAHEAAEARISALAADAAALRARAEEMEKSHAEAMSRLEQAHRDALARERSAAEERAAALRAEFDAREAQFKAVIQAAAAEAMTASGRQLLSLAAERFGKDQEQAKGELEARKQAVEAMVKPIADTLGETKRKLEEIEKDRAASFAQVTEQVGAMKSAGEALKRETANLVQALRKPQVRGRYGEVQLRRVAELAGMRDYCDFSEQESSRDEAGRLRRPDMLVKLPNGRAIAVDAKTNIEAYLDAIQSESPEQAEEHLDRFARHVADQAKALAEKKYWAQQPDSPEFTVMFIPGDQFIDAALQRRGDLIEEAARQNVILASPSTLIGLLRAVAVGWREKKLSDSANELFKLGRELHDRSANVLEAVSRVGRSIGAAAVAYNELVGSLDARLMPTLRKFEEGDAKSSAELKEPAAIEVTIRPVKSLPANANEAGSSAPRR